MQQQLTSTDSFEAIEVRSETKRHKHIFNWSDQNEKGDMQHLNTNRIGSEIDKFDTYMDWIRGKNDVDLTENSNPQN